MLYARPILLFTGIIAMMGGALISSCAYSAPKACVYGEATSCADFNHESQSVARFLLFNEGKAPLTGENRPAVATSQEPCWAVQNDSENQSVYLTRPSARCVASGCSNNQCLQVVTDCSDVKKRSYQCLAASMTPTNSNHFWTGFTTALIGLLMTVAAVASRNCNAGASLSEPYKTSKTAVQHPTSTTTANMNNRLLEHENQRAPTYVVP